MLNVAIKSIMPTVVMPSVVVVNVVESLKLNEISLSLSRVWWYQRLSQMWFEHEMQQNLSSDNINWNVVKNSMPLKIHYYICMHIFSHWVFQWSWHTWVQFNTDLFSSDAKYLYANAWQEAILIQMNNN